MLLHIPFTEDQGRPMLPTCVLASCSHFHFAYGFDTRKLASMLDSLVRVSRRVGKSRFGKINDFPQASISFALQLFGVRHLILPFRGLSNCK